mmetsp:Transcript_32818/g.71635  ORF Transcript_32818/g.71635 Transcript_32818/m.71635 type:complete len:331 (+) Transcript_32818:38-1030(+)
MAPVKRELPSFDLQELAQIGAGVACQSLSDRLAKALECDGILYLTNFGISEEEFEEFRHVTRAIFDASPEEQEKYIVSGLPLRGLTKLEGESTAKVLCTGEHSDLCMKYSWGDAGAVPNVAPNDVFKAAWESTHDKMTAIAKQVLLCIAKVLDLTDVDALLNGDALTRHLRYPDVKEERCADKSDTVERMATHFDMTLLSVLCQTPCPNGFVSLQALIGDDWVPVPYVAGTLVVNFGAVLNAITNGRVLAAKHRVVAPPTELREGSSRESTVLFYMADPELLLKPLQGGNGGAVMCFGEPLPAEGMKAGAFLGQLLSRFKTDQPSPSVVA